MFSIAVIDNSFVPPFGRFEEWTAKGKSNGLWEALVDSCGAGMIVLTLLDLTRLAVGIPLRIPGRFWFIT